MIYLLPCGTCGLISEVKGEPGEVVEWKCKHKTHLADVTEEDEEGKTKTVKKPYLNLSSLGQ